MSKEQSFLDAIRNEPNEEAHRLVYADWLEENGDARGEFLRLEHELNALEAKTESWMLLMEQLRDVGEDFEADWLALVSRPLLANTFWEGDTAWEDASGNEVYQIRFWPHNVFEYRPEDHLGRPTQDDAYHWKQIGRSISLSYNNGYGTEIGIITGNRMEGRGSSKHGRWTWWLEPITENEAWGALS